MDIKNGIDYEYSYYTKYNIDGNRRYKYEEEGVLNKCIPKALFKGNTILTTFLQLIDMRIIMILHYVDMLKQFKYITRY